MIPMGTIIAHELARAFDPKTGRGSFELLAVELDGDGRFVSAGALGQFHYTHQSDYPSVRRQAESDTVAQYRQIRALRAQLAPLA